MQASDNNAGALSPAELHVDPMQSPGGEEDAQSYNSFEIIDDLQNIITSMEESTVHDDRFIKPSPAINKKLTRASVKKDLTPSTLNYNVSTRSPFDKGSVEKRNQLPMHASIENDAQLHTVVWRPSKHTGDINVNAFEFGRDFEDKSPPESGGKEPRTQLHKLL
jgi:hypothetical protein